LLAFQHLVVLAQDRAVSTGRKNFPLDVVIAGTFGRPLRLRLLRRSPAWRLGDHPCTAAGDTTRAQGGSTPGQQARKAGRRGSLAAALPQFRARL